MIDHDKMHDTYLRVVDHSYDPPRCLFGSLFDFEYGYQVSSDQAPNTKWYMRGELPPRYPMPATMDNAVMALFNQPNLITRWSVAWFKRALHKTI